MPYLNNSDYPSNRENKIKLLAKYNIQINNISNFVITYNLYSNREYINMFAKNKESLILNIQNIINSNSFDTKNKKVYIFENTSILNEIMVRKIDASVIITSVFSNISVYLLLDKLIEQNNQLYYNGDFDPEGLLIAQKFKDKYQDKLHLFGYSETDYNNCVSTKLINQKRLNKLTNITNNDLLLIKELLLKRKYSAYQENNKERLITYIQNN